MHEVTREDFIKHVGSAFHTVLDGSPVLDITLIDVHSFATSDSQGEIECRPKPYSLLFHGPCDPQLPQQIFRLEHAELGALDIFLVPLGPDRGGQKMCYEAVFN
jgi:hypothetical protein